MRYCRKLILGGHISALIAAVVLVSTVGLGVTHAADRVADKESAWKRALAYTGFDGDEAVFDKEDTNAVRGVYTDTLTPFLYPKTKGVAVWVCSFSDVYLDFADSRFTEEAIKDQIRKTYKVYLRESDGKLLKIETRSQDGALSLCSEPRAEDATENRRARNHYYEGYPDELPRASLVAAMKESLSSNALAAQEILAEYVMYSYLGEEPKPCWVMITRGIPPVILTGTSYERPQWELERVWSVVDASEGKWLRFDYGPPPRKPHEE